MPQGVEGLWDDVPAIAPGFQRTHVVADSGHSVQDDQPAKLVEILRGLIL
nr:hypothetical protein [Mycobacterium sp. 155]